MDTVVESDGGSQVAALAPTPSCPPARHSTQTVEESFQATMSLLAELQKKNKEVPEWKALIHCLV